MKPVGLGIRATLILACIASVGVFNLHASAQILDVYQAGHPIQLRVVLIPGHARVTFRTDLHLSNPPGVSYSDTVLSLIVSGTGYAAGADRWDSSPECLEHGVGGGWMPSCFTYENPHATARLGFLIGRAWKSHTAALTQLWAYGPGQVNGPMPDPENANSTAAVVLGGGSFDHTFSTGEFISTAHLAGDADRHVLLIRNADNNGHAEELYWTKSGNGSIVYELADYSFDLSGINGIPSASVGITYGGFGFANTGPLRMLRNDGPDFDGDGLSRALEQALGTCDQPWGDYMASGRPCSTLQFCNTRSNADEVATCNAQLRDTDHDGLRDDIEVFGYNLPTAHMARYGANPAHKDVFVELHTTDRLPGGACDGFTLGNVLDVGGDDNFFERIDMLYSQAPASLNPDGQPGISTHFDVGVVNPNPLDAASWGDWGAGGKCLSDPNGTQYYSLCIANQGVRNWLFLWGLDGPGNGQAAGGSSCYRASSTAIHAHEIGHVLGLDHVGPHNTSAAGVGAANGRPTYYSRMNYHYQNLAQGSASDADWSSLSFSFGSNGQSSARVVNEIDPLPGQSLRPIELTGTSVSGSNVDWNGDGEYVGMSNMSVYRERENGRNARAPSIHPNLQTGRYGTHHDAVMVNGVLLYGYVKSGASYIKANSDAACSMVPQPGGPGDFPTYGDCIELGYSQLRAWFVDAVSMSAARLPSGQEGLLTVSRSGTSLYWKYSTVTGQPASALQAFVASTGIGGSMPASWPTMDTSVDVTLQALPPTAANPLGGTILIYQDNAQNLRQAFLPGGSTTWSAAMLVNGAFLGTLGGVEGDVGTVIHDGVLYMALRPTAYPGIVLYTMPLDANQNTYWMWTWPLLPFGDDAVDIELASAPAPTGNDSTELYLFFQDTSNTIQQSRATWVGGVLTWRSPSISGRVEDERGFSTVAAVYDGRAIAGDAVGLRAFRNTHRTCPMGNRTACADSGYWPGRPADLACNTTSDYCTSATSGGQLLSLVKFSPFATGLHPTEFCDYDDWDGLDWGMCQRLANESAPLDDGPGSVLYSTPVRCRVRPAFPEPTNSGTCVSLPQPPADDRTTHPSYYSW